MGQFVPLKIVTSRKSSDWQKWSKEYPLKERGIPQLYVVRADGKQLYAGVGSLPGEKLHTMLASSLKQAGRNFTDRESLLLSETVNKAIAKYDEGKLLAAANELTKILDIASPDELNSYAKPAVEAKELYENILKSADDMVKAAKSKLAADEEADRFSAVLDIAQVQAIYKLFPKLKAESGKVTRGLRKDAEQAGLLKQAEALVKARNIATSPNENIRNRANTFYAAVIKRFPATPADELARKELSEIDPDAKILKTVPEQTDYRLWKAANGKFSTEAKFVARKGNKIKLEKKDGKTIVVDIEKLSADDQKHLEDL